MYIVFGNKVVDSEEIKNLIINNSHFKVIKDLSKGTKREDVVAFNISMDIDILKEILSDDYDINHISEDELNEEIFNLFEEVGGDLIEFLPDDSLSCVKGYCLDESFNEVRGVFIMVNEELGERKLNDILNRLLTQVD